MEREGPVSRDPKGSEDTPDWAAARGKMILDPTVTMLNTGSFGPLPRPVFDRATELRLRLAAGPTDFFVRQAPPLLWEARERTAAFLGMCSGTARLHHKRVGRDQPRRFGAQARVAGRNPDERPRIRRDDLVLGAGRTATGALDPHVPAADDDKRPSRDRRVDGAGDDAAHAAPLLQPRPVANWPRVAREGVVRRSAAARHPHRGRWRACAGDDPAQRERDRARTSTPRTCTSGCSRQAARAFSSSAPETRTDLQPLHVSWGYHPDKYPIGELIQSAGPDSRDNYGSTPRIRFLEFEGTRDICPWLAVPAAIDFQTELGWNAIREANRGTGGIHAPRDSASARDAGHSRSSRRDDRVRATRGRERTEAAQGVVEPPHRNPDHRTTRAIADPGEPPLLHDRSGDRPIGGGAAGGDGEWWQFSMIKSRVSANRRQMTALGRRAILRSKVAELQVRDTETLRWKRGLFISGIGG